MEIESDTQEKNQELVFLDTFTYLKLSQPHEVGRIISTLKMKTPSLRSCNDQLRSHGQEVAAGIEAQLWLRPKLLCGFRLLPGTLRLQCQKASWEESGLRVPSWRCSGPPGGPGRILPTPRKLMSAA